MDLLKNPKPIVGYISLVALGTLGNFLNVPLGFGIEIIFGSIATLLAVVIFGTQLGVIAAAIASSYTFIIWHHPYSVFVAIAEALFVGLMFRRIRSNLPLTVGTFWILIGMPFIFFSYSLGLEIDKEGVYLAAIKQAANGIFNSIIAGFILTYIPFSQKMRSLEHKKITVFQNIFNIFVAAALVPTVIVIVMDAHHVVKQVEQTAQSRLDTITTGASLSVERWLDQQMKSITTVARLAEQFRLENRKLLQTVVANNQVITPDFLSTFIMNKDGITIAFDPPLNIKGESTIGLDFSDRAYFQTLRDGGESPYVSEVFMARGGLFEPVFNVSSIIKDKNKIVGVAAASLNLRQLNEILHFMPTGHDFMATILDRNGRVIVSDDLNHKTLAEYRNGIKGYFEPISEDYYYHRPEDRTLAPMEKWSRSSLGRRVSIPGPSGWVLIVEMPLAPLQKALYDRYIQTMSFLLGLVIVILIGSIWMATRIAKPLALLSSETTNLPERLQSAETIRWPKTEMFELKVLVENFKATVEALKKRFSDLEQSREQLKKAKEDAEMANRLKSAFLANMSHEIRTPLGIMIGFADLIVDKDSKAEDKKKFAEILKRNGEQLSVIINDILDLSKVEAGHLSIEISDFSLRELLNEIVTDFSKRAQDKGLRLELFISNEVPDTLYSDRVRLRQILWNLMGNAIKFTEKGSIQLKVLANGDFLEMEVKDSGIGIDPDQQQKMFKPFSQLDESMTRRFGGTGLGLALSKRLSQLLNGDLILKESRVGEGSIFHLKIKNQVEKIAYLGSSTASVNPQDLAPNTVPEETLRGLKVLLVEDAIDNQLLIKRILNKKGVDVDLADNGRVGVDMALKGPYNVVVMDLQMPEMDGYTATEKLRSSGFDKPIIALSAHAMSDIKERCLESGFTDHLPKPINSKQLVSTLVKHSHYSAHL